MNSSDPALLPPRPPGVVWVDASAVTTVVRCERCNKNYGPWVDETQAARFAKQHREHHSTDTPFDWSSWSEERLLKNPGGRPPLDDRPLCSDNECTEPVHGKGYCMKHYQAHRRAARRAA